MKLSIKALLILSVVLFCSCQDDYLDDHRNIKTYNNERVTPNSTFYIDAPRSTANIADSDILRSLEAGNDVCEYREVTRRNVVILPETEPHIWVGNVLSKSALLNNIYKPIRGRKSPITLSTSISRVDSRTIDRPTLSSYLRYLNDTRLLDATNLDHNEFTFEIEQFSSYNELKSAFGCNVNIANLFSLQDKVPSLVEPKTRKATGLYLRFQSTSFEIMMDTPKELFASVPQNLIDSSAYISSISYGKLGVLALECNLDAKTAKETLHRISKKLFKTRERIITKEERDFLEQCTLRLYMLGGDGSTVVKRLQGADGFLKALLAASDRETIVPICYTMSNLRDNSIHNSKFKYRISYEPLYVKFKEDGTSSEDSNKSIATYSVSLEFFRDSQYQHRAIADPNIVFSLDHETITTYGIDSMGIHVEPLRKQNLNRNTSLLIGIVQNENELILDPYPPHNRRIDLFSIDRKRIRRTVYHTYTLDMNSRFIANTYWWSGRLPKGGLTIE